MRTLDDQGNALGNCPAPSHLPATPGLTGKISLPLLIAVVADLVQFGLLPSLVVGALVNVVLDIVVAVALIGLMGWHWAFLPTFVVESLPVIDLFPTWTASVIYVMRTQTRNPEG